MGSDVTGDPSLSPLLALGDRWEHECEGGTHGIGEIQELPDYHGSSSLQEHTNRGKDVTADDELYDPINYSAEHESVERFATGPLKLPFCSCRT